KVKAKEVGWAGLATGKVMTLAVDSEYEGADTLTIQYAVRFEDEIRLQLYYSPQVPPPPRGCFGRSFIGRFPERVVVLPPKPISSDLSPARVLAGILGLPEAEYLSRSAGDDHPEPRAPRECKRGRRRLPRIDVTLVGHFLRVDLL